jgi:hypothetical protein
MRRCQGLVVAVSVVAVWGAGALAVPGGGDARAVAAPTAGLWGRAIAVPGLGALNKGRDAAVGSVSCASPGNCAAGGYYRDQHRKFQGFVVSERNGRWRRAIEVPGLGTLNKRGHAEVRSVSCGSAGNCAAGGPYRDGDGHGQGFVLSERNGRWGKAIEVPGLTALNAAGAVVFSVSCGSSGSCAAGGFYSDGHGHQQGFLVSETSGVWGQAIDVPGLATLNKGRHAKVFSVSCPSAGNCAAVGRYRNAHGFVASETNGVWGQAIRVPGLDALNRDSAQFYLDISVSCGSSGNCAAVGTYGYPYGSGYVASEKNGAWGRARDVGAGGRDSGVLSVSCAPAGSCAAGGYWGDSSLTPHAFVVSEKNGVWGRVIKVPGLRALNTGGDAEVLSVSCAAAGSCAAGGYYTGTGRGYQTQGFVTQ